MIAIKIVRKIGKILRGGAGRKEIFLGILCGVLIGFNPGVSMTLALAILITLLLNANVPFVLLGAALGKVLCLALAPVTFRTGYFIIHNIGMEGLFTNLVNAPFTALMDLNVYSMVGGLPYALVIGIAVGSALGTAVIKIRKKMLEADQHEIIGKTFGNKFARFLLRLAFGKSKLTFEDEIPKKSPLFRKSGLILVGSVLAIGLVLDFLLLDIFLEKSIQSSIRARTGAEVNIGKAHLSLAGGKLELKNLQVTDPDKPTHNLIQIEQLAADLSVSDLLRRTYTIDLLSGSVLKRDVERAAPGKVFQKPEKDKTGEAEKGEDAEGGKSIDDYLAKAETCKRYGQKVNEYLKERKANAETAARGEKPKASKEKAVADAKKVGYLKARADLVVDRPEWTIRTLVIDRVQLSSDYPVQKFQGSELSSHPELNGRPTTLVMTPQESTEPTAAITLHFEDPSAVHEITANLKDVDFGKAIKTGDNLKIEEGKADIKVEGSFSADSLDVPFTLAVRELKTDNDVINNLKNLEVPGKLYGSLTAPRVKVELDDNLKDAVVDAAKDKAEEEAQKAASKELDKAMQSEEAEEVKSKAGDAIKKLF